jgi:hypothetical protein
MKIDNTLKYDALLIDTSIFDTYGLRLEKGLLGKLYQFKRSSIEFLMPDVICSEVITHLEQKIRVSRSALEKSINDAGDHLFYDGSKLSDIKALLLNSDEVEKIAETRLNKFLEMTGALVIECGDYLSVSSLLKQYFSNKAPFSESGKKKNEFPDAIILMAVESWAKKNNKVVLSISKDDDWSRYCLQSTRLFCIDELSDGLTFFNKAVLPYEFLQKLKTELDNGEAQFFLDGIAKSLESIFDDFTPDQDADSYLYWEPEGSTGWFKSFHLISNDFQLIDKAEKFIVIKGYAAITVCAEGEFSLSVYDSMDKEYVYVDFVTSTVEDEFQTEILITMSGNLDELVIDEVEIVTPIKSMHFGTLEPNFSDD